MFYACYSGDSDTPCIKDLMEVTLVGRSREIRDEQKKKIYKILPKICINPSDMIDTVFSGTWFGVRGGSIYNGNTLITPPTKALELYAICGPKDQGTCLMVYKTLFYVSYLLRYRLLKQAHMYTLNTFHPH